MISSTASKTALTASVAIVAAPIAAFARTFQSAPLPLPTPLVDARTLPDAAPPKEMEIFALPTGVTHRNAGQAHRGGSFLDRRDFAMAGTLIRHPQGDILVDTGFGRTIDEQFASMPAWFRRVTKWTRWTTAADLLDKAGYDLDSLNMILPTHAHWDHISGLPDFPGKPVHITAQELTFIHQGGHGQFATPLDGIDWQIYGFESGPYLGYGRSHDVYGDGSVVCVPAPGHTPGGVIVFITLPNRTRYALIGDIVWQREALDQLEERPWIFRRFGDLDPHQLRHDIQYLRALKDRFPELIIVPAHDQRGFAEMPALPASFR